MVVVPDLLAAAGPAPARAFDLGADAYIVYTSGTTGTPKGVRISHRALRCFVGNAALALGFGPATRCLCVSPFHFDGTYSTIFPTLAAGAALVVPKREDLVFIKPFFGMVAEHSITHAAFSPTFLGLLISSRKLATLAGGSLRSVHMGGSQCPAPDVAKLWEMLPDVRVFNLYGPAEATVAVSAYEVRREDVAAGRIPFGEPYAGTEFFMVSDEGHLVTGAGELGELYIGGEQLMEGYFGDDELNSKSPEARRRAREDPVQDWGPGLS